MEKYILQITNGTNISLPIICNDKADLTEKIDSLTELQKPDALFYKIDKFLDHETTLKLLKKL